MKWVLALTVLLTVTSCAFTPPRRGEEQRGNIDVLDVRGAVIGLAVTYQASPTPLVRLQSTGSSPLLHVRPERLSADGVLYYESSDCSGVPFLDNISTLMYGQVTTWLASTAIGPPGRTVYVGVPFAKRRSMLVKSFLLDEQCYTGAFETSVAPVRAVTDITTFTPPFTVGGAR